MSSDTSEDENLELLREAVDPQFLSNDLFDPNKKKDVNRQAQQIMKPSLRHQDEKEENHMNVTPEFQEYVSRQLSKFLDSRIKEVDVPLRKHESKNGIEGGIRLFGTSTIPVSCDESAELTTRHLKKRKEWKKRRDEETKISEEERCREAAISAEWILSQDAVEGWEPSTKGKLETYSAKDVTIKGVKCRIENQKIETPEEKAERKKLKRKKCRERLKLKNQSCGANKESVNA